MLAWSRICAVVAAPDAKSMSRQLELALRQTNTAELRLDWLAGDSEIEAFVQAIGRLDLRKPTSLIATCRRVAAGGRYRGTIAKQLAHLTAAIRSGCAWYDLEIETVRECPPELLDVLLGEAKQLTSAHFFDRMPRDLARVGAELSRAGGAAIKIAAQCDSLRDSRKLLRFARERGNIVAMPMGEVALPARLLAIRDGSSAFTYAPVAGATAPGQISLGDMKGVYRADRLNAKTRVYGVIGDPIGHSLSPQMHNAGYAARKIDAVYLPFLVHDLKDFVDVIGDFGIRGFSVTIPHKERILRYLDSCDPLAEKIDAVNTVVVRRNGKLHGLNTDYVGVLRALEKRMPPRGSRVLIVGAGGAARAVAFALAQAGASVCLWARRPEQAAALARAVGGEAIERSRLKRESFDAIVNTTPVGMHPLTSQSPLQARELNCRLVFDTIYRPQVTKLLQLAARRGIETVSGVEMFVAQGAAQWEIWTEERAPDAVMRKAVLGALAVDAGEGEQPAKSGTVRKRPRR